MKTKIGSAIASGSTESAIASLTNDIQRQLGGAAPGLVVAFSSTSQPLEDVVHRLTRTFPAAVVLGSSTAGEFIESGDAKASTAVFAVAGDLKIFGGIGTSLKANPERAVTQALEGLPRSVNGYPHQTAILLLDPLAGVSEEATLIAAGILGEGVRLAGGAAGDDLQMKATHVALGGRAASDAVVVALIFSKSPLGVGVCHGHRPISGSLRVTGAEGGKVATIEGRPAWDVWLEQTRERATLAGIDVTRMTAEEEGAFLLRYEAGLAAGDDFKIRAPLSRNADGSINFACGVPEGTVIRITESVADQQISSAREAARRARAQLDGRAVAGALVFDCICRNLILGARFAEAVKAMSDELGNVPLAGFETYGEIALDAGDMSGFHNTTSVVLAFPLE